MKSLVAVLTLSTALAIGTTACAHQQLAKSHVKETAASVAVIASIVLIAVATQCDSCTISPAPSTTSALPPR